jgi:hypothetical protein
MSDIPYELRNHVPIIGNQYWTTVYTAVKEFCHKGRQRGKLLLGLAMVIYGVVVSTIYGWKPVEKVL